MAELDHFKSHVRPDTGLGGGKARPRELMVGLTVQRLTRAAKALVATAERHAACPHLKRAMQAA